MIESFVNYLVYEKRYSPNTIISYKNDIKQFYKYIENSYSVYDIKGINHYMIRSWLVDLMQNDISPKSINRKFSSLRTYFLFLKREGKIDVNPTKKVIPPKTGKRLPSIVQKKEMDFLLDELVFSENFHGYRDKVIISILYNTGMRRAELINLKDHDFDYVSGTVKVLGKGNKERIIPLTYDVISLLKTYMDIRNSFFENNSFNYTILTDKGNKLYPKFVYNVVTKYLSMVSSVDKKSPHVLRHSIATHLADEDVELNAIKTMLGHANLSATQIYTHNSIEKLKRAYKKAHPKAN